MNGVFRVSAVVLHYQHWPGMRRALDALADSTFGISEMVIVDNCPGCAHVAEIESAYPRAVVVAAAANRGYAGGMNLGLEHVRDSDAVLMLTHETVLDADALGHLVQELRSHEDVGLVGPLLVDTSSNKVWGVGGRVGPSGRGLGRPGEGEKVEAWTGRAPFDTQWSDGACLLVRARALADVRGFDERFHLYVEEVDFCLRLRAAGWRVLAVPAARARQSSGGFAVALLTRNELLLVEVHFGRAAAGRAVLRTLKAIARGVGHEPREQRRERIRGLAAYLSRQWGPLP